MDVEFIRWCMYTRICVLYLVPGIFYVMTKKWWLVSLQRVQLSSLLANHVVTQQHKKMHIYMQCMWNRQKYEETQGVDRFFCAPGGRLWNSRYNSIKYLVYSTCVYRRTEEGIPRLVIILNMKCVSKRSSIIYYFRAIVECQKIHQFVRECKHYVHIKVLRRWSLHFPNKYEVR